MAASVTAPTAKESTFAEQAGFYLRRPAVLLSVIAVITLLLYVSTLSFEFVWDDHVQIESNPLVLSWKAIPRAFHSSLWFQMSADGKGSYYRPLFLAWSVLNHSLFGFQPWGWHLGNVLLHIVASLLVFVLGRRLNIEYWAAAIAALAFAIHPVHIEPVAWISAGSDIIVAIFYVLAFLAFLEWREGQGRRRIFWMLGSWVLFACSLLTKEMALTFPVIVVLYCWLVAPEDRHRGVIARLSQALLVSLPYAVLNVLYLIQRGRILHSFAQTQKNYGALVDLITVPSVLINYLRLLVFPSGLTGFYFTPYVRNFSFGRFVLPTVGLALVVALIWWWSRRERDPLIAFFGLWLPICLIPVLYLPAFTNGDFVRDRYLYLPSIGFTYLAAKAIRRIPARLRDRSSGWLQPAAVVVMSAGFAFGVLTQQVYFASDLLVFHRGCSLYPDNPIPKKDLALVFNQRGDPESAMVLLQQAVRIDPTDSYTHWLMAVVNAEFHRDEEAKQELVRAVNLSPQYFLQTPHGLANMGHAFAAAHDYVQAETYLRQSLALEPEATPSLVYMGLLLMRTNRPGEAETYLNKAATLDPQGYDVNWALGMLAQMRGDRASAEQKYSEELHLHPDNNSAKLALTALKSLK